MDKINMFRPSMNGIEETRSWVTYQKILRKVYAANYRKIASLTLLELYEKIAQRTEGSDLLPVTEYCKFVDCRESLHYNDIEFHHPYQGHGKRLDSEVYHRDNKRNEYNIRSKNSGMITNGFSEHLKKVAEAKDTTGTKEWRLPSVYTTTQAADFVKFNCMKNYYNVRPKFYHAVIEPHPEAMLDWHDPFAVTLLADRYHRNNYSSLINLKPFNKELLQLRKKVYGRELSVEEWYQIGTLQPCDQRLVMSVMTDEWTTSMLIDCCKDMRRYPGMGNLIEYWPNHKVCGEFGIVMQWRQWVDACNKVAESVYDRRASQDPVRGESNARKFVDDFDNRKDYGWLEEEEEVTETFENCCPGEERNIFENYIQITDDTFDLERYQIEEDMRQAQAEELVLLERIDDNFDEGYQQQRGWGDESDEEPSEDTAGWGFIGGYYDENGLVTDLDNDEDVGYELPYGLDSNEDIDFGLYQIE